MLLRMCPLLSASGSGFGMRLWNVAQGSARAPIPHIRTGEADCAHDVGRKSDVSYALQLISTYCLYSFDNMGLGHSVLRCSRFLKVLGEYGPSSISYSPVLLVS
jgi:hypothetical protein